MLPYITLFLFAAQYCYPIFHTLTTVLDPKARKPAIAQWMVFWVISSTVSFLEEFVLQGVLSEYVPLWDELKLIMVLWLVSPYFHGASWLWYAFGRDQHRFFSQKVEEEVRSKAVPQLMIMADKAHPKVAPVLRKLGSQIMGEEKTE